MVKNKSLGRGLDILIPTFQTDDREAQDSPVKEISIMISNLIHISQDENLLLKN